MAAAAVAADSAAVAAATQGPHVLPGTYNVALVVDGKTIDTKPMKVVVDPGSPVAPTSQRKRYNDIVMDLHDMQRRGTQVADGAERRSTTQMTELASKIKDMNNVPAAVKTQFDALNKEFEALRPSSACRPARAAAAWRAAAVAALAVAVAAAARRRRARRRRSGAQPQRRARNRRRGRCGGALVPAVAAPRRRIRAWSARPGRVKNQIMSIWEMPSDTLHEAVHAT